LTCLHIDDTDTDNSKDDSTSHITIKRSISTSSLRHDVKQMIQWMSQIKSIATDGIQPIYTPLQIIESANTKHYAIDTHTNSDIQDDTKRHPSMLHPHNKPSERYRHDIATEGNIQRDVLSNASHTIRIVVSLLYQRLSIFMLIVNHSGFRCIYHSVYLIDFFKVSTCCLRGHTTMIV
jgi:Asp-tRNA(Asn)/Glu-tRNA(Gln) amidotransferase C subunit